MAIGPIQYLPQQDPFSGLGELVQAGQMIQQQRLRQQQQEAAQQRMQQYQTDVEEYFKSPTAQGAARLSAKYPEQSKAFEEGWKTLNAQQQQSELKDTQSVIAALSQGRADIAQSLISKRAEALRAAGQDAGELDSMLELVKTNPDQAKGYMMFTLAALPGGKDAVEALGKIGTEQRAQELQPSTLAKSEAEAQKTGAEAVIKTEEAKVAPEKVKLDIQTGYANLKQIGANVANLQSQVSDRAARLKLDRERLTLETQKFLTETEIKLADIGEAGKKLVNDAAVSASASKLSAAKANDLADRITQIGSSWGSFGSFAEWLKKTTGEQGGVTQLRNEYTRLRNSEGLKSLPPGPATDKDVELALKGIPPETADPKVLESFLRGVAKMNDINAAVDRAKADYVGQNRGVLGKAKTAFDAGGISVRPGDDWTTVAQKAAEQASRQYTPKDDQVSVVDQIPTGNPYAPRPGTGNVVNWGDLK